MKQLLVRLKEKVSESLSTEEGFLEVVKILRWDLQDVPVH